MGARQIREEHAFTQELFDLEIPVVSPMKLVSDETHVQVDGFELALFPNSSVGLQSSMIWIVCSRWEDLSPESTPSAPKALQLSATFAP